ncbi:MAG: hypothetical protein ACOC3Z_02410 [Nanoarchaeota archaeon]
MFVCENCEIHHDGNYGSGRFCSIKCARSYSTKTKRLEINSKISKTLLGKKSLNKKPNIIKICKYCGITFDVTQTYKHQKFCSKKCSNKGQKRPGWSVCHDKLTKEDWSKINKLSYKEGNNYIAGGTTKWYKYKDIKVQGTYELRTCKILDDWKEKNKIKNWEYTNDRFEYIGLDNKKHNYLIDFKIFKNNDDFYYLEVKGWEKPNDKLKWDSVKKQGYNLIIWFNKDIINEENKMNN